MSRIITFCILLGVVSTNVWCQGIENLGHQSLPVPNGPMLIDATIEVNKIYNVSTIDQTYDIDGYLSLKWMDSSVLDWPEAIYLNDDAADLMSKYLWHPAYEFMNVLEKEDGLDIRIVTEPDGQITYTERFKATFYSEMNFKKFPFDNQSFNIDIESFLYTSEYFQFNTLQLHLNKNKRDNVFHKWTVIGEPKVQINDRYSDRLNKSFSRGSFRIQAKRETGYYQWQVLFPLFLIIGSSWIVFWIKTLGEQLNIAFTLMLTVVAFNFYTNTLLPKLPYNTFIETVIISGYIFLFLTIVGIVCNNWFVSGKDSFVLIKPFRLAFPFAFIMTMVSLCAYYQVYV